MFRYKKSIGLDMQNGAARVVLARRRLFAARICESFSINLPEDDGEAVEVMRGFFQKKGWSGTPCVIGLRGESLMLRVLSCAARDPASINAVIEEQMNHFTDISSAATVCEYSLASGSRESGRQLILAIARIDTVLSQIDRARQVGLNVVDLVPGPVALFNSAAFMLARFSAPVVCVDVGEDSTQVVIGQGRSLYFSRRFIMGGSSLMVARPDSQRSLFDTSDQGGADGENLGSDRRFAEWMSELKACLTFYRSRFQNVRMNPARMIISGRVKFSTNRIKAVNDATGIPTQMISELKRASNLRSDDSLAAATGFALTGLGRERIRISLLPSHLREMFALQWQLKYWFAAAAALILATFVLLYRLNIDVANKNIILEEKTSRLQELEQLEGQLEFLRDENRESRRQLHPLRAAVANGLIYRAVLGALAEAKNSDDLITMIADSASYFGDPLPPAARTRVIDSPESRSEVPIRRFSKIVVEGYTPLDDLSTVRAMIEKLREHDIIDEVDLLPDDRVRSSMPGDRESWANLNLTRYAIEISVVRQ